MKNLFQKYDVPAPRYTSYPTVPYWENTPSTDQWCTNLRTHLSSNDASFSLYIHIPYCETLCTFCGCNNVITKDHKKEVPYVESVLKEWSLYLQNVPEIRNAELKLLHLGGGTPTFLSADHLKQLLEPILKSVKVAKNFEGSIEVDPRRTTALQLQALRELGFNRISLGVQDFDPEVQRLINRLQPFEITERITEEARQLGYQSVNFDLIYGLARQTKDSILTTVSKTLELQPDRIALYSLALVPWIKPAQRLFKDEDLPAGEEKRTLYEVARFALLDAGYVEIGMDHFALPQEALSLSQKKGELHRNFMGYTDQKTPVLLGLGVSSISETPDMFHQNEKVLPTYFQQIEKEKIPTFRGHVLTDEDKRQRQQILEFMTKGKVKLAESQLKEAREFLKEMEKDGLIQFQESFLILTEKGHPFLRNACLFFDERLKRKQPTTQVFSKAV